MEYSHRSIEKKWQKFWEENDTFRTTNNNAKKAYILDMFPYPSGAGLHVGHPKGYTATDIVSRMRRMQGYDVLHPIGYDSFGLPAEQYAIQTGNDPAEFTMKNIANFRTQLKALGFSYDYKKEIYTSNPNYYKFTQWIFKKLYEHNLAELKEVDVNWCEELKTVLANEEVLNINGVMVSERGHHPVVRKPMKQWVLKITAYAEKLLAGLDDLKWPQSVKDLQKNWIGKSIGTKINFKVDNNTDQYIEVFTTRADTIYGVNYLVLAPEHHLVSKLVSKELEADYQKFLSEVKAKSDLDRQDQSKEKMGMFIGSYAINPMNNKKIPIWIADYVLPFYGTGAVMAVPGHDERDYVFALKYDLPITYVIEGEHHNNVYLKDGEHINSDILNGLNIKQAIAKVEEVLGKKNLAVKDISYKLKDWLFSRQRYWGEPFPVIHWEDGSITLLDDSELPLELPRLDNIRPSTNGESPLANADNWLEVVDVTGKKGRRETNTMPQWAGSCWYYLAYILCQEDGSLIPIDSKEAYELFKKWLPVDLYIGGQEHAVLHLLYARFWHQFLYDINIVPTKEPFYCLINQGMILGPDGSKMSKSKGNVINPDDIIKSHGADTLRMYEMFMGPIEASLAWNVRGLDSMRKWLDRVFRLVKLERFTKVNNQKLDNEYHLMVKKTTEMLENYQFNTAISQMMIFINACYKNDEQIYLDYFLGFLKILSCFAPHVAEEMWHLLGQTSSIAHSSWPTYDEKYLQKDNLIIPVQVNGKLRAKLEVEKDLDEDKLYELAVNNSNVKQLLENRTIVKKIVIKNKIVNLVVK